MTARSPGLPKLSRRVALGALLASVMSVPTFEGCAKSAPASCELNSDCELGYYCGDEKLCKADCVDASRDCPMGYICNTIGKCEYGNSGGAGPSGSSTGLTNSTVGTQSGNPQTGNTSAVTDASSTSANASTSSGGVTKAELDICFADGECSGSLRCRAMSKGSSMRCTPVCAADSECPQGFRCQNPGDGTKVCLTSDVGRTCTMADQCNFGCLTGPQTCTASCASGADCPNGYGCMMVANQSVCVKAEAYCGSDTSVCIAAAACDSSTAQLVVSSCTLACNSAADCPQRAAPLAPWTCNGLCQRPGDVYGPLAGGATPVAYACNASSQVVNLCNDGQHIDFTQFTIPNPPAVNCASSTTTNGVPGDACVDSCRFQGACAFGFGCTGVGGVSGQRIGLCLPAGLGEVGDPCTTDSGCAFAYCHAGSCSRDCSKDGICPTGSTCTDGGAPAIEGLAFRRCE